MYKIIAGLVSDVSIQICWEESPAGAGWCSECDCVQDLGRSSYGHETCKAMHPLAIEEHPPVLEIHSTAERQHTLRLGWNRIDVRSRYFAAEVSNPKYANKLNTLQVLSRASRNFAFNRPCSEKGRGPMAHYDGHFVNSVFCHHNLAH